MRGHQQFTCSTTAEPSRVWAALTAPEETRKYLYGLAAHSCWQVEAAIRFCHEQHALQGQVMHAEPPCRLSYYLTAGPDDPPTYLTWQIRASPTGSTIRLQIDETEPRDRRLRRGSRRHLATGAGGAATASRGVAALALTLT